jgi:hypothetical protein
MIVESIPIIVEKDYVDHICIMNNFLHKVRDRDETNVVLEYLRKELNRELWLDTQNGVGFNLNIFFISKSNIKYFKNHYYVFKPDHFIDYLKKHSWNIINNFDFEGSSEKEKLYNSFIEAIHANFSKKTLEFIKSTYAYKFMEKQIKMIEAEKEENFKNTFRIDHFIFTLLQSLKIDLNFDNHNLKRGILLSKRSSQTVDNLMDIFKPIHQSDVRNNKIKVFFKDEETKELKHKYAHLLTEDIKVKILNILRRKKNVLF